LPVIVTQRQLKAGHSDPSYWGRATGGFQNLISIFWYNMIFIYCNWVSKRWQWSVDLHKNMKKQHQKGTMYKGIQK